MARSPPGREYASADVSERALHEIYLPPFAAAVAAGTAAIMPAFIDVAGAPMTANAKLLQGWLRGVVGFEGVLISDYNAVAELLNHGVAADLVEAAALALNAGVDIDMTSGAYVQCLPEALERGLVTMAAIDACVLRVLKLKERLGLFDDPYRRGSGRPQAGRAAERRELAREAARRAIVLLSNRTGALPLSPEIRRVAVIGPLAAAPGEMLGSWASAGKPENAVSILEGLKAALPHCRIDHAIGVEITGDSTDGISAAVDLCAGAEAVVLCLGESAAMSGEAASRVDLDLPGRQRALAEAILDLGKPVVVTLSSGRPLTSAVAVRARGRGLGDVVSWARSRARDRRRSDRQIQSNRALAGELAASCRAGPDLLQRASFWSSLRSRRALLEHVS